MTKNQQEINIYQRGNEAAIDPPGRCRSYSAEYLRRFGDRGAVANSWSSIHRLKQDSKHRLSCLSLHVWFSWWRMFLFVVQVFISVFVCVCCVCVCVCVYNNAMKRNLPFYWFLLLLQHFHAFNLNLIIDKSEPIHPLVFFMTLFILLLLNKVIQHLPALFEIRNVSQLSHTTKDIMPRWKEIERKKHRKTCTSDVDIYLSVWKLCKNNLRHRGFSEPRWNP